jgi:hypothetical protein
LVTVDYGIEFRRVSDSMDEPSHQTARETCVRRNNDSFAVRHPAWPPHASRHRRDQTIIGPNCGRRKVDRDRDG